MGRFLVREVLVQDHRLPVVSSVRIGADHSLKDAEGTPTGSDVNAEVIGHEHAHGIVFKQNSTPTTPVEIAMTLVRVIGKALHGPTAATPSESGGMGLLELLAQA